MFRFKPYYFILAFVLVIITISITGRIKLKNVPEAGNDEKLEELTSSLFKEVTQKNVVTGILVYSDNSDLCNKLEYRLYHLRNEIQTEFYKINIADHPEKYNISGTPSLLFYKNGYEIKRAMGMINESNLRLITKRLEK